MFAGDGECDACPLTQGASTEDEMFVLLGSVTTALPEPTAEWLGVSVLGVLGWLARRRRANA